MEGWSFLTNHARVLLRIASDPGMRLRNIAASLGITERSAYSIVTDLSESGYVVKQKNGRRNRYQVQAHLPLPEPASQAPAIGEVLNLLVGHGARRHLDAATTVDASPLDVWERAGASMSSPSQPAHLSNHQRNTLRQIFQHPGGHNIEWRTVLSLLGAVGSAQERHDGKVAVTIASQTEYFDPPRYKDISTQAVVNLRRMLAQAGYRTITAEPPAESAP
ncbi:MAG TPA: hypothetical protein VGS19_00565 [Streptosporangiaceae bacterium]|nr:hypothetical protein [Streptosporangiaceae bacterium]